MKYILSKATYESFNNYLKQIAVKLYIWNSLRQNKIYKKSVVLICWSLVGLCSVGYISHIICIYLHWCIILFVFCFSFSNCYWSTQFTWRQLFYFKRVSDVNILVSNVKFYTHNKCFFFRFCYMTSSLLIFVF